MRDISLCECYGRKGRVSFNTKGLWCFPASRSMSYMGHGNFKDENDIPKSSENSWQVKNRQKERLGLEDVDSYQWSCKNLWGPLANTPIAANCWPQPCTRRMDAAEWGPRSWCVIVATAQQGWLKAGGTAKAAAAPRRLQEPVVRKGEKKGQHLHPNCKSQIITNHNI